MSASWIVVSGCHARRNGCSELTYEESGCAASPGVADVEHACESSHATRAHLGARSCGCEQGVMNDCDVLRGSGSNEDEKADLLLSNLQICKIELQCHNG